MATAGVKTIDLPPVAMIDSIMGNLSGSAAKLPINDLATQLLGEGPIADKFSSGLLDIPAVLLDEAMTYTPGLPGTVVVGEYFQTNDGKNVLQFADAAATDHYLETAGGVKFNIPHGWIGSFTGSTPKTRAIDRSQAAIMADDLSEMVGYAAHSGTTGGTGAPIYWVIKVTDSYRAPEVGSFRWAVNQVAANGSGRVIFDPHYKMDVNLVRHIDTPANCTIDAPGRNVTIRHDYDKTGIKVAADNCVVRRLTIGALLKTDTSGGEQDGIWVDQNAADNVWLDQITAADNADGCIDIATTAVLAADCRITVSHCMFRNHDKAMLISALNSSASDPIHCLVTIYRCYFQTAQRNPQCYAQCYAHIVECYYQIGIVTGDDGIAGGCYGVWANTGGQALVESCLFTTSHGAGHDAAYASLGGAIKINNCLTENGLILTETDASSVIVPPYAAIGSAIVDTQTGRRDFEQAILAGAGAEVDASPQGVFIWNETSDAEPNGETVISMNGTVAGRYLLQGAAPALGIASDSAQAIFGPDNSGGSYGIGVFGEQIVLGSDVNRGVFAGYQHTIDNAAYGSAAIGRGHTGNGVAWSMSAGLFPDDNTTDIFYVGWGTSLGNRQTAMGVDKDTGAVWMGKMAIPEGNTVAISGGAITVTVGAHTISPESGLIDDLDNITMASVVDGQELRLRPASGSHEITLLHNASNAVGDIMLPSGASITLMGSDEMIALVWVEAISRWVVGH